jgi:hypothetical protein
LIVVAAYLVNEAIDSVAKGLKRLGLLAPVCGPWLFDARRPRMITVFLFAFFFALPASF